MDDDFDIEDTKGLPQQGFKRPTAKERAGPGADAVRKKRIEFLVKAYLHHEGDVEALKATIPPDKLANMVALDEWFGKDFKVNAGLILEEGIMQNLVEMATSKTAQTMPSAKAVLPALNKRRWNQGVQKQETANEGVSEFLKMASDKPMSHKELMQILVVVDPKLIVLGEGVDALKMLSLEEAIKIESNKLPVIETTAVIEGVAIQRGVPLPEEQIEEDEDLRDR